MLWIVGYKNCPGGVYVMQRIAIFCGSRFGNRDIFSASSRELVNVLLNKRIGVVYGGASVGLMGVIADEMIKGGGEVIGVIPKKLLEKKGELSHKGLKDLYLVDSMHERNALMAELADAFIALPGGIGTLEEILEALTWTILGIHAKPCGVLNVNGFYNLLNDLLDNCVEYDFLSKDNRKLLIIDKDPNKLIEKLIDLKLNMEGLIVGNC